MKITKQEMTLYEIIRSITSGEKKTGDYILTKDYNIMPKQMTIIFKILDENNIAKRTKDKGYVLTENCAENAQKLFIQKIEENIDVIITLAQKANIPPEQVVEMVTNKMLKNEDDNI